LKAIMAMMEKDKKRKFNLRIQGIDTGPSIVLGATGGIAREGVNFLLSTC